MQIRLVYIAITTACIVITLTGCGRTDATKVIKALREDDTARAREIIENSSWDSLSKDGEVDRNVSMAFQHLPSYTPFEFACKKCNMEIMKLLIDKGADVNMNIDSSSWFTPLELVLKSGENNRYLAAKLLIEEGADYNYITKSVNKECPLTYCLRTNEEQSDQCTVEGMELFKFLYDNTKRNELEMQAIYDELLIKAAEENNTAAIEFLIEVGYDVNYQSPDTGETALIWATIHGNKDAVFVILDNGADASVEDFRGRTALYYAKQGADITGDKTIMDLIKMSD